MRVEVDADTETPVSAFLKLSRGRRHAFLLESVEGGERSARFSFLGAGPRSVLRWKLGDPGDPMDRVRAMLRSHEAVRVPGTPRFAGGLVGWMTYDAVRLFEPRVPVAKPDEHGFPDVELMDFDLVIAFDNVRLFQKTREMSITDEITPLFNFRYFHQTLDRELKLVDRYGSTLSLLFIDLDRFKPINDTYGHLRGSRTLREVGFLIRAGVRDTDIPVRYGGDEFVVVLPQTDGPAAKVLGEKLRSLIEEHTFLQEEGIDAQLGASVGVATYPLEAKTKEALIRLADKRMYDDKDARKGGR